ncbi:MAG TPA: sugar ABC transporter ATP-binding protein [Ideonella sp.]|uniref:sugar ABC transporter ATP-binding protein n=1 Tax=Ideonella sp. TaxID=1929293 RepID=UPI002E2FED53|nr:sugar ABC transporter ATP-binding protein [Ideonella sp.]HEX5687828.1 sugar ABC transporter ATP-binding protein [Ideonella sp.]
MSKHGTPVLELIGISKRFAGVQALRDVALSLRAGEVHALMGQNGAGKSTLIKVLTGVHTADAGEMRLGGEPIRPASPLQAQAIGLSTVYQEVNLCPNLSVAENIFAGRFPRHGLAGGWRIDWKKVNADARVLLARLNLEIDVTRLLGTYPVAVQQMVAIARALLAKSRVLILDEPTSSLDADEVARLFALLRQLRSEGLAILFVTHFLDEVYEIADRITVLRNGERVGEYLTSELNAPALISAMIGREFHASTAVLTATDGIAREPLLEATGLARRGAIEPLDIELRAGEVLGLAGLLGSGRTELARLLFGMDKPDAGELRLRGQALKLPTPTQAVRHGLAMCPEDRKAEGIVADLSLRENIALALQARLGVWRCMSPQKQQALAERFIQQLGIKASDADMPIGQLSGGNQQKALLARWLATEPALLILDEPTRGIDVAAKQDIMDQIRALAGGGLSVLFISSELDEVARLSDRVVVMRERRKAGELPGGSSEAAICAVIAGAAA